MGIFTNYLNETNQEKEKKKKLNGNLYNINPKKTNKMGATMKFQSFRKVDKSL
jgi:hypothetical protein